MTWVVCQRLRLDRAVVSLFFSLHQVLKFRLYVRFFLDENSSLWFYVSILSSWQQSCWHRVDIELTSYLSRSESNFVSSLSIRSDSCRVEWLSLSKWSSDLLEISSKFQHSEEQVRRLRDENTEYEMNWSRDLRALLNDRRHLKYTHANQNLQFFSSVSSFERFESCLLLSIMTSEHRSF